MNASPRPLSLSREEHANIALEAWKKVVQTQEHFNEIEMKVRTLYATVLAAILSLYGVFMKDASKSGMDFGGLHADPILIVCFSIFVVSTLFYFVDRYWYHRLLLGAVLQGKEIEERWGSVLPEIQLGAKITANSVVDLSGRPKTAWVLKRIIDDQRFQQSNKLHSDAKIEVFYKPIRAFAFCAFWFAFVFGGIRYDGRSLASWLWDGIRQVCC